MGVAKQILFLGERSFSPVEIFSSRQNLFCLQKHTCSNKNQYIDALSKTPQALKKD